MASHTPNTLPHKSRLVTLVNPITLDEACEEKNKKAGPK